MDRYQVNLENLRFFAFHGFFPEERILGNWYLINLHITLHSDREIKDVLGQTLDYGSLYAVCKEVMNDPVDLLETVVERIVERIKFLSDQIAEINLELFKENPPLGQSSGKSSISIHLKL
ncbi:MAG: dihydroneopterin aldolase [Aquirufa sp.]